MTHRATNRDPVEAARARLTRATLWLTLFGALFVAGLVYGLGDPSDAFFIVHIRGGILGSGFEVPFVGALLFTGLGTVLLIREVGRARHAYAQAKKDAKSPAGTSAI